jgi:hypothetical protein
MRMKPGARAVRLQAAQAGKAASGDLGQPSSLRMTAPGRISVPHVAMASFAGLRSVPFGSTVTIPQAATPMRTISAKGIWRVGVSPASACGVTTVS